MLIRALDLVNIRSYGKQRIEFPEGITLLSGDIGAGKSTMLLAIEFALFGLARGELTGAALLRHGAQSGSVTLDFSIDDQDYRICRTLKQSSSGITQDNGWIESAKGREALTPSELRARAFELLGYPLQFLGKQRNILYRFTIYTPQEEMKAILSQSTDERIETVRRIFGIDAYRIARDNAHLLARALKDRETTNDAVIARIRTEKERLAQRLDAEKELTAQQRTLLEEQKRFAERVTQAEQAAAEKELERMKAEHELQLQLMQARNRGVMEQELEHFLQQRSRKEHMATDAATLAVQLRSTHDLLMKEDAEPEERTRELLEEARKRLEQLRQDEGKVLGIIEQCKHAPAIKAGDTCPTCRQVVAASHIEELRTTLAAQSEAARRKQEKLSQLTAAQRKAIDGLQLALDRARQRSDIAGRLATQEKLAKEHGDDLAAIDKLIAGKRSAIDAIPQGAVDKRLEERHRQLDQELAERKGILRQAQQQRLELEKRLGRIEQELQQIGQAREQLALLERDLLLQEETRDRDAILRSWVSKQFSQFAANVERHVLLSIHATFDASFRQWFSRLIEDDALSCRIDAEFTPVVLQNGYETDVAHLSGGERTSVSLAYRLALVHTIAALLPHVGTAGLIMLDEPTDGFSSEQLERVRDVLRELSMRQIILVSHEQQLEGFVDHILRVRKSGAGSVIETAA